MRHRNDKSTLPSNLLNPKVAIDSDMISNEALFMVDSGFAGFFKTFFVRPDLFIGYKV
jgi:hypothetical protein